MKVEMEINLKRIAAVLAVIAWVAAFLQGFNGLWQFWTWPIQTVSDYWGTSSSFNCWVWFGSAFLTGIIAVVLTLCAVDWEE